MRSDNSCRIRTPEGVIFRLYPAGLPRRMLACLIDALMIAAIGTVVGKFAGIFMIWGQFTVVAVRILLMFAVGIFYWIVLEWLWNGRTVGKRVLGLRVIDVDGLKLLPQQVAIRNLLRAVDFLPAFYMLGALSCFLNRQSRRLGDIAAGTMVIREVTPALPDLGGVLPDKFNSLKECPIEAARLRDMVAPEESRLLLDALMRRDTLDAADRCAVYAELATHLKSKVKFPGAVIDGMSDEKFLRNVADILYRD